MKEEAKTVIIRINQQKGLLDCLPAEGTWGKAPGEVMRNVFRQWCQDQVIRPGRGEEPC